MSVVAWPKISFLIPTLNCDNVLEKCLKSISLQDYPKDQIELVIGDGGSTDRTLAIAQNYNAKIINNPLKTAESGKMAALKFATGDFVALVDSDNELPNTLWLKNMIEPLLEHEDAVGSEPWEYTLRPTDGFITRYCALIGMNDPLVLFLGNFDRRNYITDSRNEWTLTPHIEQDFGKYLYVKFGEAGIPTIGANGTVFRTMFLKEHATGDYLFDIDILAEVLSKQGEVAFIKVKEGILHSYCEADISKFVRKQKRRVTDYLFYKSSGRRTYPWNKVNYEGYLKFILYCIFVFPLLIQSIKGYLHKHDSAWAFHVLACEITLWEYSMGAVKSLFAKSELDRTNWKQ